MPSPSPRGRGLLVAAVVTGLAGLCAAVMGLRGAPGPPQPPAWAAATRPVNHTGTVLGRSVPEQLSVRSIGLRAPLTSLGLEADGSVQVPPASRPRLAGWYADGPAPGERGAAVILGHVDTHNGPAVFYELGRLRPGDTIEVSRQDRVTAVFTIESVERVVKDRFPTERVYGPLDYPGLHLVTCGGTFDAASKSYTDNVIVYAAEVAVH